MQWGALSGACLGKGYMDDISCYKVQLRVLFASFFLGGVHTMSMHADCLIICKKPLKFCLKYIEKGACLTFAFIRVP